MRTNKLLMILLASTLLLASCQKKNPSESKESDNSQESDESVESTESNAGTESEAGLDELNKENLIKAMNKTLNCYYESSIKIVRPGDDEVTFLIENADGVRKIKAGDSYYEVVKPGIGIICYELDDGDWTIYRDSLGVSYGIEVAGLGHFESSLEIDNYFDGFTFENDMARGSDQYGDLVIKVDLDSGYVLSYKYGENDDYYYNLEFSNFGNVSVNIPTPSKFEINNSINDEIRNLGKYNDLVFTMQFDDDPAKEYTYHGEQKVLEIGKTDGNNDYIRSEYLRDINDYIYHRLSYSNDIEMYIEEFNVNDEDVQNFNTLLYLFDDNLKEFVDDSFEVLLNDATQELVLKVELFGMDGKIHFNTDFYISKIEFELVNTYCVINILSFEEYEDDFELPSYTFDEVGIYQLCQNTVKNIPAVGDTFDDIIGCDYWFSVEIESPELTAYLSCRYYHSYDEYLLYFDLESPDVEHTYYDVYAEFKNGAYVFYEAPDGEYSKRTEISVDTFNIYLAYLTSNLHHELFDFNEVMQCAKSASPINKGAVINGTFAGDDEVVYDFVLTYIANDYDTAIGQVYYVEHNSETNEKTADIHLTYNVSLLQDYRLEL